MASTDDSPKLPLMALRPTPTWGEPLRLYSAPADEVWFIEEMACRIGLRLPDESLTPQVRQGLLRLLWGLQRFPIVTPGLNVGVSWSAMESHCFIEATPECVHFCVDHTRLTYFIGSHELFQHGAVLLQAEERQQFLAVWASEFCGLAVAGNDLAVEDHSTGDLVDRPLMLASYAWIDEDGELDLP